MEFSILLIVAIALDGIAGDPRWFPHPVRLIGLLTGKLEHFHRSWIRSDTYAGVMTVITTIAVTLFTITVLLVGSGLISISVQVGLAVLIIYFFLAAKDLFVHSQEVYHHLTREMDLQLARESVGRIVGRDTAAMSEKDVIRACVETVAENLVDGITAPLFWSVVFALASLFFPVEPILLGALGITFYKTVNTMDSMFGYKNEQYIDFGWAPARLDDLVNYLPARLSGLSVVLASLIIGENWRNSFNILKRDRLNHSSPNAGYTEAAVAGALSIQLGGPSHYFGKIVNKPYIGEMLTEIEPYHISKTNTLVLWTTAVFTFLLLLLYICLTSIYST